MAVQASAEVLITAALVQIVLSEPNAFPRAGEAARGWPRTVARSTAPSSIVDQRRF